jgi:predicted P-loop ATPase
MSPDLSPAAIAFRQERDRAELARAPNNGSHYPPPPNGEDDYGVANSAPNNIADFVAAAAKPKRKRPTSALPDWASRCIFDDYGRIIPNLANVLIALRALPEVKDTFAYDEMSCTAILRRALPVAPNGENASSAQLPRAVRDEDVSQLQEWLQHQGMPKIGKDQVHQAVDQRAMERSFHPIRDYLDGLKWDKTPRLDDWLSTYLGSAKDAYTAKIGRMFLIGMVARIFEPGCKMDYMLVLEGDQGDRKSTALRILAGEWFSDGLPDLHHGDAVRLSMHLRGKWLIEIGELSAFGKAGTEALKAFITRQEEKFTPKFARKEVTEPRQCAFAGSTNKDAYLKDETGARRFLPFKVGTIDLDALARGRDQLWAEAVARFREGAHWWPEADFEREHIRPQQEARYEADAWETAILGYIQEHKTVRLTEIATIALGFDGQSRLGTADQRRIAAVLTHHRWEARRDMKGAFYANPARTPA